MRDKVEKSYQIFYSNDCMNSEYFAQIPGDISKTEKLAKDLAKRYDKVRIQETTVITKTIKVFA